MSNFVEDQKEIQFLRAQLVYKEEVIHNLREAYVKMQEGLRILLCNNDSALGKHKIGVAKRMFTDIFNSKRTGT